MIDRRTLIIAGGVLALAVTLGIAIGLRLENMVAQTVALGVAVGIVAGSISGGLTAWLVLRQGQIVSSGHPTWNGEDLPPGVFLTDDQAAALFHLLDEEPPASGAFSPRPRRSREFTAVGGAALDDSPQEG